MKGILIVLLNTCFLAQQAFAQAEAGRGHTKGRHENGVWEISPSFIYSYAAAEQEGLLKTELHLTYWFTHQWGGGLSYTRKYINSEDINDDIALIGSWNATARWKVNLGLNYTIPKKGGEEGLWGLYNELEFNIRPSVWFSYGPVIGSVISKETEVYAGIHVGFEF